MNTHRTGNDPGDEISLIALGNIVLRGRRTIGFLALMGAAFGLAAGLLSARVYLSEATFIPQGGDVGVPSGLALAASQFGVRVPATSGAWGPPIYVELLRSRALLEPVARDTVAVAEEGGKRVAVMDLLEIKAPTPSKRLERTIKKLLTIVTASENRQLGAVKLSVATRWPSISLTFADKLVQGVNRFNLETRKSQAAAERQFAETQATEAEAALRAAEDRMQDFLQRNRSINGSQELTFALDRLRREVALRQQVYTALVQNREEAKIREVRDTPVITVLESPRLPIVSESRNSLQKTLLGGVAGALLGIILAFVARAFEGARRTATEDAQEFFHLVNEATPRFLRRKNPSL